MTEALLGLGSNLGDPMEHLRQAVRSLAEVGHVVRRSSVYRSAPVGYAAQPDFLNAAVALHTECAPRTLLGRVHDIEARAGRVRTFPGAPRTLDIDILFYGDRAVDGPGLTIPHPRWSERSFVLAPLAEIAADQADPVSGRTVAEVWEERRSELPPVQRCAVLDPEESEGPEESGEPGP